MYSMKEIFMLTHFQNHYLKKARAEAISCYLVGEGERKKRPLNDLL